MPLAATVLLLPWPPAWGQAAPTPQADLLVAAVATQGSPHQPFGSEVIAGAEATAARLNAAGGVAGQSVRVVGWSEDCSRTRAQQIAEEVVRLRPALVIGHLCAGAALTAAPIYAKAGILLIVPGVRHPGLTTAPTAHPLVFRLAGRDDRFAAETVRFITRHLPGAGVAIVTDRTLQARGLASGVAAALAQQKVKVALQEPLDSGEKSYAAIAARIRASGAGVVVMPAQPVELGVVVQGLRQAGVTATLVGSDILAVPSIEATARQEAGRLVLMLPWTGLEHRAAATADREAAFSGRSAREAVRIRAEAALEVWAAGVRQAGTADAEAVALQLRSTAAPTSVGPLVFDALGDAVVPSYVAHSWRDGGWREAGP